MDIFLLISLKLLPLYIFIILGFIAGKIFKVEAKQIGTLVIYVIMPFIFWVGLWQSDIKLPDLTIFVILWTLALCICVISYFLCGLVYKDNARNLMASGLPAGNSGYFGIPVALALFDQNTFAIYLIASISNTIFQITIGYYLLALGNFHWKDAAKKLLYLPPLYGAALGLFFSFTDIPLPDVIKDTSVTLKEAFVVLGMMIIGLTLSSFKKIKFDIKFLSVAMFIRFAIWPALVFIFIVIDTSLGSYFKTLYPILILFSFLPVGADFAIYASNLNLYPQRAATAVLISTLIAAILIPLVQTLQ